MQCSQCFVNLAKFFTMVRPRSTSSGKRTSAQRENLSALSSEVLKLRLQALNLPIAGSRGQLLARLKRPCLGTPAKRRCAPRRRHRWVQRMCKLVTVVPIRPQTASNLPKRQTVHHRVQSRTKPNKRTTPSRTKLRRPQSTKCSKGTNQSHLPPSRRRH